MDADKLDELERLLKAGTPGPWTRDGIVIAHLPKPSGMPKEVCLLGYPLHHPLDRSPPFPNADENAALICAAINALEELVAMGRRVAELEARVQELENAGSEMVDWAEHARIFVGSREKMHPDGQSFYDQARGNLYAVITRAALKGTPT